MKRFVVIYRDRAFPVRSKSMERVRQDIMKAYAAQDGSELVRVGNIDMVSSDIANGKYRVLAIEEWFSESAKTKKGAHRAPLLVQR